VSSDAYPFPVALSRLDDGDSRETQNARAITWLLQQGTAPIVLVTPRRELPGDTLSALAARADVTHLTWRGFSSAALIQKRMIYAWPDLEHLADLRGVRVAALVVIEWNQSHSAEWIADAAPDLLLPGEAQRPAAPIAPPAGRLDTATSASGRAGHHGP